MLSDGERLERTRADPLCAAVKLAALATLGAKIGSIWRDGTWPDGVGCADAAVRTWMKRPA